MKRSLIIATSLFASTLIAEGPNPPVRRSRAEVIVQDAKQKNATASDLQIKEWKISTEEFKQLFPSSVQTWETKKPTPSQPKDVSRREDRHIVCTGADSFKPGPWAAYGPSHGSFIVRWLPEDIGKFDTLLKEFREGLKRSHNRRQK